MQAIKATIKGGRIETDTPVNLPDGTQVLIVEATAPTIDWNNSPEGIARWFESYDSLEPLVFTDEERAAWQQDRIAQRAWEFAHAEERDQQLREIWE